MATPLKEGLNEAAVTRLAKNLQRAYPAFKVRAFVREVVPGLAVLELKDRVAHVASVLPKYLPEEYREALKVLLLAQDGWVRGKKGDSLGGFASWPIFDFIQNEGLAHFSSSMDALARLTSLFTAEFAVRPYIARYPDKSFKKLLKWSLHRDEHVRRLASEGCRPRLPWATQVPALLANPSPILPILENLKDDPQEYVRRSVANNLNDIAKDHPDLVIDICAKWLKGATKERRWLVERATRSLVKDAHPRVWALLGFAKSPQVSVESFRLMPKKLKLGGNISFSFDLVSQGRSAQRLAIDYAIHFVKANGSTRPKVFKLKVLTLKAGQSLALQKKQSIKAISTRKFYPGKHKVELLINGKSSGTVSFDLTL